MQTKQLHVTIASSPIRGAGLAHEISMLKTALLYADRVTLISPVASLYLPLDDFQNDPVDKKLHTFFSWAEVTGLMNVNIQKVYHRYEFLKKRKHRKPAEIIEYETLRRKLSRAFDNSKFVEQARQIAEDAGAAHIRTAISEGYVQIEKLNTYGKDIAMEFFSTVLKTLLTGDSYPLIDSGTGKLVDSFFQVVHPLSIPNSKIDRSKQTKLNDALLQGLPDFSDASLDEILDIRDDLKPYLLKYRASVIQFSEEIQSIPWSDSFSSDVERIYLKHVAPAISAISEAVKGSSELRCLARRLQEDSWMWIAAFGLAAVALAGDVPSLSPIAPSVAGGKAIADLFKARNDAVDKTKQVKSHSLYFLHRVGDRVKKN